MLTVSGLNVHYGPVHAVKGVDISARAGAVTALLGANGAGKTSTLMAIAGARRISSGEVSLGGRSIVAATPEDNIRAGIAVVPEGRRVFAALTVEENLSLSGAVLADRVLAGKRKDAMMTRFPILRERARQRAGLLSGGEQQMLAIARALMSGPKLLLLDEPSLGLAPQMVERVFDLIEELRDEGIAILLVEQNVPMSLEIAETVVVLANGCVSVQGAAADLADNDIIRDAYLAA